MDAPDPDDLIDTDEARRLLGGVDREVLDEIVAAEHLTQYRMTPRVIRYSRAAVLTYLKTTAAAAGLAACRKKVEKKVRRRKGG